jgi:hypothetical protein
MDDPPGSKEGLFPLIASSGLHLYKLVSTNLQWHIDHDHNLNNQPEKAGRQPKSDQRTGTVFRSGRPSHVQ